MTDERRPGILFSQMEPPPELEHGFKDWYEAEHIPARMRIPGFTAARRYVAHEGRPRYLAVYDLSSLATLERPEYRALKDRPSPATDRMLAAVRGFTRFTCLEQSDTGPALPTDWLSVVAFAVPEGEHAALDAWYENEHIPLLMEEPGWRRVRRYRVLSGEGATWTHLALHEIDSRAAMESPARAAARQAPQREALSARGWFSTSGRWIYELISTAIGESAVPTTESRGA